MKKILQFLLVTLILSILQSGNLLPAQAAPVKTDSSHIELLLTNKMLSNIHLDKKFIPSLDITSKRLILLSTREQFYLLGWGGIAPIGKKSTGSIGSFAFTFDNLLMAVRGSELCTMDSLGNLSKLMKLPGEGMGVSAGKFVMYIYDRNKNLQKNALYVIAKGGKYSRLLEVPAPINSVTELKNKVLFTIGNAVFSYNLKDKGISAILTVAKDKEIKSLTADTLNNRIYFSDGNSVFAIKDSVAVVISSEFGGVLRYFNQGLIVFNPEKNLLIRITELEDKIASKITEMKSAPVGEKTAVLPPPAAAVIVVPPPVSAAAKTATGTSGSPEKEIKVPANTIRVEGFISNTSGNLEKGKLYIFKKDFSRQADILVNFSEGSVLKFTGTNPGDVKSWKVVKVADGSFALIDSKLYVYFEQAHMWLLKPTQ